MYKNYQILFNHIEELTTMVKKAEEISDRFPYVFVFAIGNLTCRFENQAARR